ncbi:MAG: DUF3466 family protein [Phycisphaerales bacterium]|nr:DUF3466 family protein [Phycisphaerales bacterium]
MQRYPNPFLFAAIIVCSATLAHGADYSVTLISIGPEQIPAVAKDINASGQVTGYSQPQPRDYNLSVLPLPAWPSPPQAFLFQNGQGTFLSMPEGVQATYGYAINDSGTVVGPTGNLFRPSFVYSDGQMTIISSPQSASGQLVDRRDMIGFYAINASGDTVGGTFPSSLLDDHAAIWSNGSLQHIGTLPGATGSSAYGINDAGLIVGTATTFSSTTITRRAFLYDHGTMIDLGSLGGRNSTATAINNIGQITGSADLGIGIGAHAYLYDNGEMIDLGDLGGGYSTGLAINNLGQVVGYSYIVSLPPINHAFLYTNGQMLDLNSLIDPASGWVLWEATGINDAGQIVGHGYFNGIPHAFLLTPISVVPEPATLPVLALATLALARRRRA